MEVNKMTNNCKENIQNDISEIANMQMRKMHNEAWARMHGIPTREETIIIQNIKDQRELEGEDCYIPQEVLERVKEFL